MDKHRLIDTDITRMRLKVLEMAAYAERAMDTTLRALLERDTSLAQMVVDRDAQINQLECDIDHEALRLLALKQPLADDLRFIIGCMRIIVNIERIGDECVTIAERALILAQRPALPFNHMLEELATLSLEMLRTAIKSFADDDPELAETVCDRENRAAEIDLSIIKKLIDYMLQETPAIERTVHTVLASRSLERCASLATNVAESVIFIVKGVDVKHRCHRI